MFTNLFSFILFLVVCNPRNIGCFGVVWGGWSAERTHSGSYELTGGSQYDEVRTVLGSHEGVTVNSQLATELTESYLDSINVFFTGYVVDNNSILSSAEQQTLKTWVQEKGGVLLIAGCYGTNYNSCRSFMEPFELQKEDAHVSGLFHISCISGVHEIVDGVNTLYIANPQYLLPTDDIDMTVLCTMDDGKITDAIIRFGNGHIFFSNMLLYRDDYMDDDDNTKYFDNLVAWTEQLECPGCSSGIPGECVLTNCDDNNLCTIDSCDVDTNTCINNVVNCDDNNVCTIDSCDMSTGICVNTDIFCDDGDVCTWDSCDPVSGCQSNSAEECFPMLHSIFDDLQMLKSHLIQPHPTQAPTPTSLPTQKTSLPTTSPTFGGLHIPTPPPTGQPTTPPTAAVTQVPVHDVLSEIIRAIQQLQTKLESAVEEIQILRETSQETKAHVAELENQISTVVNSLQPAPTQIPTRLPTLIPTTQPTRPPAQCEASDEYTREHFLNEENETCFSFAETCRSDNNCLEVLNDESCNFPLDLIYGPDVCWNNVFGFNENQYDEDSDESELLSESEGYQFWINLTECVQQVCGCIYSPGEWNGHILSLHVQPTISSCCLTCKDTNGCEKWHFVGQMCALFDVNALLDNSDQNTNFVHGIK